MHFQVQMKVRLDKPLALGGNPGESGTGLSSDDRPVIGYFITMKINAADLADAVALAHPMALAPPDRAGKPRTFAGVVEQANVFEIEPTGGAEPVRPALAPSDQRGVYYKTGLMFFHEGEEEEQTKKWWQFWKR